MEIIILRDILNTVKQKEKLVTNVGKRTFLQWVYQKQIKIAHIENLKRTFFTTLNFSLQHMNVKIENDKTKVILNTGSTIDFINKETFNNIQTGNKSMKLIKSK